MEAKTWFVGGKVSEMPINSNDKLVEESERPMCNAVNLAVPYIYTLWKILCIFAIFIIKVIILLNMALTVLIWNLVNNYINQCKEVIEENMNIYITKIY